MANDLSKRLSAIAVAAARYALHQLGIERVVPKGIQALNSSAIVAGPVRTVRFLPRREDIEGFPRGRLSRDIVETLQPGEILVFDAMGALDAAMIGDNHARRLIQL